MYYTVDPRTSDPLGSKPAFLRAPASATDRATDPTNFLSTTILMSDDETVVSGNTTEDGDDDDGAAAIEEEVIAIMDERTAVYGTIEYQLLLKGGRGRGPAVMTWEPADNLTNCDEALADWTEDKDDNDRRERAEVGAAAKATEKENK